jgi:hypothetical protein
MSQRACGRIGVDTAWRLAGQVAGMTVEVYDGAILPKSRAAPQDESAPGRAQRPIIAADTLPLGHNC